MGLTTVGCAAGPRLIPVTDPAQGIQFEGFSILPPRGENWFADPPELRQKQGEDIVALFRKMLTPPSMTHTIVATVRVVTLPPTPSSESRREILQQIALHLWKSTDRNRVVARKVSEERGLGSDCLRYDVTTEDRGVPLFPGRVFILDLHGFGCLHPDSSSHFIDVQYSERRLPEEKPHSSLEAEGEAFLKGLMFTRLAQPLAERPGMGPADYVRQGVDLINKGEYDRAISDFTRAVEIKPKYAEAYINRGLAYWSKRQYDQAISDYTKGLEMNATDAVAYNWRGIAYASKGQYDEAISDFSTALKINPRYAEAYTNRGLAYDSKHQWNQAIADHTKALEINPRLPLAYANRAMAYYYLKDYDKAWDDVYKAQALGFQSDPKFLKDLREASEREK